MGLSLCNVSIDRRGRELVEHGTVLFPVACYYDDLAGDAVPWHWHDELEAAVVTEGAGCRSSRGGEIHIAAGRWFLYQCRRSSQRMEY